MEQPRQGPGRRLGKSLFGKKTRRWRLIPQNRGLSPSRRLPRHPGRWTRRGLQTLSTSGRSARRVSGTSEANGQARRPKYPNPRTAQGGRGAPRSSGLAPPCLDGTTGTKKGSVGAHAAGEGRQRHGGKHPQLRLTQENFLENGVMCALTSFIKMCPCSARSYDNSAVPAKKPPYWVVQTNAVRILNVTNGKILWYMYLTTIFLKSPHFGSKYLWKCNSDFNTQTDNSASTSSRLLERCFRTYVGKCTARETPTFPASSSTL